MDTLSYKTVSVNVNTAQKRWVVIDAEGLVLGRLASQVAKMIMGKHKPDFTPHADSGDFVIVVNADKIHLTGKKWTDKVYVRHTGYPGGQRFETPREIVNKKSATILIEKAVRGMLPKNRLGRKLFHHLFVYVGPSHPHEAQQPESITLQIK
ncbi:MAG: 50S ribosomal protein L13 [Microscillaceae bacterium]|nr:50S ribosomal protein L13 [Microscillaceae bacterium]